MKNKLLFGSALMVLGGLATPVCLNSHAADTSGRSPADLARADRGASLTVREAGKDVPAAPAQALLGNDVAQGYALPAGTTSMILSLPKIEIVNHFDFVDAGAEGAVTVSVSSVKLPFDSADWREVAAGQAFAGRQLIPCDLGSVEARYVKLDFNTRAPGRLFGFNLFGATAPAGRSVGTVHLTMATPTGASVQADFSVDAANPAPKVVADLGEQGKLDRLTCAYDAPAGAVDFYLVDSKDQPETVGLNYIGEPTLQPASNDASAAPADGLAGRKAIYTLNTAAQADGTGRATAELGGLRGRYLVAAFRPAGHRRDIDAKDAIDTKDAKDVKEAPLSGKDKDAKSAPVFPIFAVTPFGQAPTNANTPLTPPPIGVRPPPLGGNTP